MYVVTYTEYLVTPYISFKEDRTYYSNQFYKRNYGFNKLIQSEVSYAVLSHVLDYCVYQ